jgi:hypothetical protein
MKMAVLGMKRLALQQPEEAIYQFFNGHMKMAVLGMQILALQQREEAICQSFNGRMSMAVPGSGGIVCM